MTRRYKFGEILLSGRPVFFAEGVDYDELTETFKQKWADAAKRRRLKLATRTVLDPPGIVLAAYLPHHQRPELPDGPTQKVSKDTNAPLFCRADGCNTRLTPKQMRHRQCATHRTY